jgi:hypothetical protein
MSNFIDISDFMGGAIGVVVGLVAGNQHLLEQCCSAPI